MKDVIEMAREAGGRAQADQNCDDEYLMSADALKAFEALVRADERSRMEKALDHMYGWWEPEDGENP